MKGHKNSLTGRQMQELVEWMIYLYNKGYSYAEIAEMTNLSITRQRVQQLVTKGRDSKSTKLN